MDIRPEAKHLSYWIPSVWYATLGFCVGASMTFVTHAWSLPVITIAILALGLAVSLTLVVWLRRHVTGPLARR